MITLIITTYEATTIEDLLYERLFEAQSLTQAHYNKIEFY